MRKAYTFHAALVFAILFHVPMAAATTVSVNFDYQPNFNTLSVGPFTMTQQKQAFTNPSITTQANGNTAKLISITSLCKTSGNHCLRFYYPQGTVGSGWDSSIWGTLGFAIYQQSVPVFNVEYDWYFEPGFDLTGGIGKIGPFLTYHHDNPYSGFQEITIWRTNSNGYGYFVPCVQAQSSGGTTICATTAQKEQGPAIQTGQWYHVRMQAANGPNGYQKAWINGTLIFNNGPYIPPGTTDLQPVVFFYSWFGGAGSASAAKWDSYARIDNVHIWSGTGN
jgi:hypothetical protein